MLVTIVFDTVSEQYGCCRRGVDGWSALSVDDTKMEPDIADRDIPRSGYGAQLTWLFCPDSQTIVLHSVPAGIRVSVKMAGVTKISRRGRPRAKSRP
jgi:hypothetical protein